MGTTFVKNLGFFWSDNDSESTTKPNMLAVIHEPTEVAPEDTMARGRKRKASINEWMSPKRPGTTRDTKLSSDKQLLDTYTEHLCSTSFPDNTSRDDFERKYVQLEKLGEGGYGCVYAGYRTSDNLPVAIKHIPLGKVETDEIVLNEEKYKIPTEVLIMQRVAGGPESVGKSAAVTLVDWFTLDQEVVLVIERPEPCVDLFNYVKEPLEEQQAKIFMKQLLNAALDISSKGVFHADIKLDNILLETSSDVPRLRLIDFGLSLFVGDTPFSAKRGYDISMAKHADPNTVKQLGVALIGMLDTLTDVDSSPSSDSYIPCLGGLYIPNVTQDCRDFLMKSLKLNPKAVRPTLEQLKQHPWINKT